MFTGRIMAVLLTALLLLAGTPPAGADAESDAAPGMGDWLTVTSLIFGGVALAAFLVALKRGLFRDLERAKYYMLTISEPDYYTPDWAKEEEDGRTDGPADGGDRRSHGEHH